MFGLPVAPKPKPATGPVVMWVGRGPRCAMPLPEGARVINPIPPRIIAPPPDPAPAPVPAPIITLTDPDDDNAADDLIMTTADIAPPALIDPDAADLIVATPDIAPPALIDAAAADLIVATPDIAPPALIDPDADDLIMTTADIAPPALQTLTSLLCPSLEEASFVQPDVLTSGALRLRLGLRFGLRLLCPLAPRPPPLSFRRDEHTYTRLPPAGTSQQR
jgi:hypothetical protein